MEIDQVIKLRARSKLSGRKFILPALALLCAIVVLHDYFVPGFQLMTGILLAPFVFRIKQHEVYSKRYAFISILFLIAFYFLHIKILLFMAAGTLIMYTVESNFGKIGILPFVFLICVSPALHYLVNSFTFSIRLELSSYAGEILQFFGMQVINKGSYFILPDGANFSVDKACIGLNMFSIGYCIVLLLIGQKELTHKKNLNLFGVGVLFVLASLLLIVTNLFRIVALVFFKSPPETFSHEMIGIASLILYTLVPMYFLIKFSVKKYGKEQGEIKSKKNINFKSAGMITIIIATGIICTNQLVRDELKYTIKDEKLYSLRINGFERSIKQDGVVEFKNNDTLIYIKPASKGFESDHPPSMCWQGSGFNLNDVSEVKYGNYTYFYAILKKDKLVQYTAWWYDNGTNKTTSQLEWRFAKGEPYRIINITTSSKDKLDRLCWEYLEKKLF